MSALVESVADMASKADGMVLFGDTTMSADPANIYLDYIGQACTAATSTALAYAGVWMPTCSNLRFHINILAS